MKAFRQALGPAATDGVAEWPIRFFAGGIALLLALLPPAIEYVSSDRTERATMSAEARLLASVVSDMASRNPTLWTFEARRVQGMLSMAGESQDPGFRRVILPDGETLAESGQRPGAWSLRTEAPILESGRQVAMLEIQEDALPLLWRALLVAIFSTALGVLAFILLHILPMRLLARAVERASHLSSHDVLTGLPNRALLEERLRQAAVNFRRRGSGALAVLYLDLDRFKEVNDTLGHAAGDQLLAEIALRLSACLGEVDTLARLGADEFAVVQAEAARMGDAPALAGRLRAACQQPFDLSGQQVLVDVSIGIAVTEEPESADPARMMQEADLALHDVKANGKNGFRVFEARMNATLQARRVLEADLRTAIATGSLRLQFQPQFELQSRQLTGAEALLRWQHPQRGNVPPDAFIALAERTGLIVPLGSWVLEEACRQAMSWAKPLKVAVNVSVVQFRQPDFLDVVRRTLERTGLPPARLELEVTESLLLIDTEEMLLTLNRLRDMGIGIAMDDFGTGYSSLSYLQRFRFDKVKIDRSFVRGLDEDPCAATIVRAILGMTDALGIRANAEGVETEAQAERLRQEGCGEVQGYLFGRPQEAEAFALLTRDSEVTSVA
jgi:diguanylate cyclase (GGDEF)-like protein